MTFCAHPISFVVVPHYPLLLPSVPANPLPRPT